MMGYWNRPEATSEAFTADGWLRTGDMARIDAQGNVIVGDRLKEFIKVKAFQVAMLSWKALCWSTMKCSMRAW